MFEASNYMEVVINDFNEIIKKHQQKVYAVVFSLVRNDVETDEIVQQTFVCAFKGLKNFRGDASIETWIIRIALNNVRSYFRKRKFLSFFYPSISEMTLRKSGVYDADGKTEDIKDDTQNTEKAVENEAVKKIINTAIDKLPSRQKEVFVMKHLNSFSITKISQVLNIAEGSVKANIFKAIKNLKKYLEGYNGLQ
ncbi:MAG: sigma-70 family RNA polymerase sigma factor [Elusimicrobiota bacterium]